MHTQSLIEQLIHALRCIPGVGPKSAQRTAYHLLEREREGAQTLVDVLSRALALIQHCRYCRMLTEKEQCDICSSSHRHQHTLCVVETPADVEAIEQTGEFQGKYFVLLGRLSPLDGIGPTDIGLDLLKARLEQENFEEIVIATNPTVEGEATAQFIIDIAQNASDVKVSRIAHGVPMGGELEYMDGHTLAFAFSQRRAVNND